MSDAHNLARQTAAAMWTMDHASQGLGMEILDIAPGMAKLSMPITPTMLNGHGTAHGGFIYTLADSAFAFACNSHNDRAVAAHCSITYLRPGRAGHKLIATAKEVSRVGRSGIYDVEVTQDGEMIAQFRGHSRLIGGTVTATPTGES